ncbi:MAG TPA: sugar transferase [Chloroflexota bacterium]|nr:sugar transferase [Chloroflexota bacterium]
MKVLLPNPGIGFGAAALTEEARLAARDRLESVFSVVTSLCLLVGDVGLVYVAFLVAHWLRFVAPDAVAQALGLEQYARQGLLVGGLTAGLFMLHGLYDAERPRAWPVRLHLIVSSLSTALLLAITLSFFTGDGRFSRIWVAGGWVLSTGALLVWRTAAHRLYVAARDALLPNDHVLIVGANALGRQLASELTGRNRVVGFVDNGSDLPEGKDAPPLLGPIAQLDQIIQRYGVDELIIAVPAERREQVSRLISRGFHREVQDRFLPDLSELLPRQFEVRHFGGRPYIGFAPVARVSPLKRGVDILAAGAGLLLLAPLFALIALLVRCDSPGPIFYRQRRLGKHGQPFDMLKFRSMYRDAEQRLADLRARNEATGPLFKMKNDPRVTRVGRILRRTSLDELPQLFNVLRGEMSLVGPRPPIPAEVEQYEDWQFGRLRARPGITGLWQVSGRSEVPFLDMVRLDLHYIRNWSLGLDVEILLRTVPAVLKSKGAY